MPAAKLADRAREALANTTGKARSKTEITRIYKAFRKAEELRLKIKHDAGGGGRDVCALRSDIYDEFLRYLWDDLILQCEFKDAAKRSISLIAVGGYARRCMNPHSDVDMTFVFPGNGLHPDTEDVAIISAFINMLFTLGIHVGDHATRSVGETFKQANGNYEIKTSLIDCRFIAGHREAFDQLKATYDKACFGKHSGQFLHDRQLDIAERHARYEHTPYRQEPHVKNGLGGLREYHNLQWVTYAKFHTTNLRELTKQDLLSAAALREIEQAYDFVLRVRTELHYVEKRESDVLTLKLQGDVAERLGYRQRHILRKIESLMKDYYRHTIAMLHRTSQVLDKLRLLTLEEELRGVKGYLARRRAKMEKFDGFIAKQSRDEKDARIYAENERIFKEEPHRLMRLFMHTQQRHLRLSPDLFELVQKSFRFVDQTFRYNTEVRESFFAILSQKGDVARVLRQMHRVGFLGKYMPEFGAMTNLVQHEFFHQYTADEHTLRCIDRLDELAGTPPKGNEFYASLFREMQEPFVLYLALILHDAGRALNSSNHALESTVLADRVCRRLHIKGERRKLLLFLVDSHLELYRTATKNDPHDPDVITDFARIMRGQQTYLDALLIFTVVDSKGTSASGWTSWKESLITQLYHNTTRYLNDPKDFMLRATGPLDEVKVAVQKLFDATYAAEIEAHFANMPRSYFNYRDADRIAFHIRTIRWHHERMEKLKAGKDVPTLTWVNHLEHGSSDLVVVCQDRPLLLARIAGALGAHNVNILSASLYRRADGVVLDIFRVCTVNFEAVSSDRTRTRVKNDVEHAFKTDDFDFSSAIAEHRRPLLGGTQQIGEIPQRAFINNDRSPEHTIIEVQAADRIGLLYDVCTAVGRLGLNIWHARINTEKGAALDTLYVQTAEGTKVTDKAMLAELNKAMEKALFA